MTGVSHPAALRYGWDQSESAALAAPERLIRRVMDVGLIEDARHWSRSEAQKALVYFDGGDEPQCLP